MTADPPARRWLWRKPLVPPAWEALDAGARAGFSAADAVIADSSRWTATLPEAGLDRMLPPPVVRWRGIHHPLTAKFAPVGIPIELSRSRSERAAALAIAREAGGAPLALPAIDLVRAAARHLTGGEAFRTTQISTDCDPMGRHIVFPGPEHIAPQFARLDRFFAESPGAAHSFRATVAVLMILNAHALSDGNGRASRLIFNLIARPGDALDHYLPLHELSVFSRGGYIIRLRQAELHGDWAPIAEFMLAAARLWHRQVALAGERAIA